MEVYRRKEGMEVGYIYNESRYGILLELQKWFGWGDEGEGG